MPALDLVSDIFNMSDAITFISTLLPIHLIGLWCVKFLVSVVFHSPAKTLTSFVFHVGLTILSQIQCSKSDSIIAV